MLSGAKLRLAAHRLGPLQQQLKRYGALAGTEALRKTDSLPPEFLASAVGCVGESVGGSSLGATSKNV